MKLIDEAEVSHIAELSRLALSDAEVTTYTQQLSEVLEYASHLPVLAEESINKVDEYLWSEEDIARLQTNPLNLLRNAVEIENGYVKVPSILDKTDVT